MWLGIAFLFLAVVAVLLQAWLWGPKFWDEEAKKTRAPRFWLRMHALAGYTYGAIYVAMMWHMVPRLWRYQTELPARTVVHAVAGIVIGVLLVSKIVILRRFRHFEEAMPRFGLGLLLSTVVLVFLSVPYAIVAHDLTGDAAAPENLERVRRHLSEVVDDPQAVAAATTPEAIARGRAVLTGKCTSCHDMRTILRRPRTAGEWLRVVRRMQEKPVVFGVPVTDEDVLPVTAYLAAVTPRIQRSERKRAADEAKARARKQAMLANVTGEEATPPADYDPARAKALFEARCTECHDADTVAEHGGGDRGQWLSVIAAMVEEGAEVAPDEANLLAAYLAERYPPAPKGTTQPKEPTTPRPAPADGTDDASEGHETSGEAATTPTAGHHGPVGRAEGSTSRPRSTSSSKARRSALKGRDRADRGKPEPAPTDDASTADAGPEAVPAKDEATESVRPDPARGKAIFLAKCKTCHGSDGRGQTAFGRKIGVPDLTTSTLAPAAMRKVVLDGRAGTKMRAFRGKLSEAELDDLMAFLSRL
ncbi:MAG: hypothetical protein D6705_01590 [Deltaproteobacteria bacterium]|nr:MAG: hypothetical protein D6705_01590 [Deltaproteobacteria bacterium]